MNKKISNSIVVVMVPIALYLFFLLLRPKSFGKINTVYIIITQSFITCMIAWGMQYLAKMGEFDLALGAEMILDSIIAALLSTRFGIPGIVAGCLLSALVCGILKGVLYRVMKIPIMILTIALIYLLGSFGGLITNSAALTIAYEHTFLGRAPGNMIVFLLTGILMYFLANKSVYGSNVNAVAGAPGISRNNGISVEKTKIRSLILSSMFAGIAAIVQLSHGSGVTPSVGLDSIQNIMQPMMSVFIGFVMAQYVNVVFSIFVGSILMSIISNGITALNWSSAIYNIVVGIILLLIMAYMNVAKVYSQKHEEKIRAIANMKEMNLSNM